MTNLRSPLALRAPALAVLASGNGTNFEALLACPRVAPCVRALVCNVSGAGVLERAKSRGVPLRLVPHAAFSSRDAHEAAMLAALDDLLEGFDLVGLVLAGYMRILGSTFLAGVTERWPAAALLNLHPAHLDQYRGPRAFPYAVETKFPRWGLSVHHVTARVDEGAVIASAELPLLPTDSPEDLHARARPVEHALLVAAARTLLEPHFAKGTHNGHNV